MYKPPKIKVFGPVGALTQGGSGMMSEVMDMGMMCMVNPNPNLQSGFC